MLGKIDRALVKCEVAAVSVMLSIITIVVFLQVLYRYVLHSPLAWTDELSRYLQVWLAFVGGSIAIQRSAHFHLDIIHNVIPQTWKNWLGLLVDIAMLVFIALLALNGTALLEIVDRQVSPAMNIKMSYAYLAIPVGCSLSAFHLVVRIAERLTPNVHQDMKGGVSQ